MKIIAKRLFIGLAVLSLFVTSLQTASVAPASALSGSEFKADRIIDDSYFYKGNTMTAGEIQNFLNSKMPSCDTNGEKPYRAGSSQTRAQWAQANGKPLPPYTCLKDHKQSYDARSDSGLCGYLAPQSSRTAAQIIDDVSRACNVSQKALIVLLQKEQSLVTDDWPWPMQYEKAMGYYCPDDPTRPGWCHPEYAGFFNQTYNAALQFNRYKLYPENFNFAINRTSHVSYQANAPSCGGTNLTLRTASTAGLYNYTPYQPNKAALDNLYGSGDSCSAYGNRNFWRMYNDWFGSTHLPASACDSKVNGVACVWSLIKTDGSQFLTTSISERDYSISKFGWIYEGVALYAPNAQLNDTIPTYRVRQNNQHYYTTNQAEYNSLINSGNWTDEGIAFYAYPATTPANASHKIYKLYSSTLNHRQWTADINKKNYLIETGYILEASDFNGFSGQASLPLPATGRVNVYRLQGLAGYFYTTSLHELDTVMRGGYLYEGVMTTASANNSGTPIYRLQRNGIHFYTADINERNNAVQKYGMTDEGIGFYLDSSSEHVYRMSNTLDARYLYTSNINEVMSIANTNGWRLEGVITGSSSASSPVYRFLNLFNHRHFYTTNLYEATSISNRNWRYEGVAFNTPKASGLPIYRLRLNDKYFYTANSNEKDIAISKYGYVYEGEAYFASQTVTSKPVYRLQGYDEYFYTTNSVERDRAVSKYGYRYEGEGFYLPATN